MMAGMDRRRQQGAEGAKGRDTEIQPTIFIFFHLIAVCTLPGNMHVNIHTHSSSQANVYQRMGSHGLCQSVTCRLRGSTMA
jgi:hypothetical protein